MAQPFVELRVHGVSGEFAAGLLDDAEPVLAAGDADAGFWWPHDNDPADLSANIEREHQREAFCWGGLTSGSKSCAYWLALLPFSLLNAAAAMHLPTQPAAKRRGITHNSTGRLLRVLALSLTVTFVMASYGAAVDEFGWQCWDADAKLRTCDAHLPKAVRDFEFLHNLNTRLFASVALILIVIAAIWQRSRRSWKLYDAQPPGPALNDINSSDATPFTDPTFWNGRDRGEVLRHSHIAAAFATLAILTSRLVESSGSGWQRVLSWLCFALGVVAVGLAIAAVASFAESDIRRRTAAVSLTISGCALVGSLVALVTTEFASDGPNNPTASFSASVTLLAVLQLVVIAAIALRNRNDRSTMRSQGAWPDATIGLRGWGLPMMCMLSLMFAALFSAALMSRTGQWLAAVSTSDGATSRRARIIQIPAVVLWSGRFGTALVLAFVVVGIIAFVRYVSYRRGCETALDRSEAPWVPWYDDGVSAAAPSSARVAERRNRVRSIAHTHALGRLPDASSRWLSGVVVCGAVCATFAVGVAASAELLGDASWLASFERNRFVRWTTSFGSWAIIGIGGALLALIVRARSSRDLRRQIGIVWDLTTFWPRTAHPLAPPCSAERSVPQLVEHIANWTRMDRRVVVSAHSQGSVLAVAALAQLSPQERTHVRLLTYGSPLRRLYGRYFPAYFGTKVLEHVLADLTPDTGEPRWINLVRPTDPIGGTVTYDDDRGAFGNAQLKKINRNVVVTSSFDPQPGDVVPPPVDAHSRYRSTREYRSALHELATD